MRFWKHKSETGKPPMLIGIAGAKRGVGVTHISVLLGEYLEIEKGAKTAILEWNSHGDFEWMEAACSGKGEKVFSYRGVDYFGRVEENQLEDILAKGYSYIIFDLGEIKQKHKKIWEMCHKKVLVGNPALWKKGAFFQMAGGLAKEKITLLYLLNLSEDEFVSSELHGHNGTKMEFKNKIIHLGYCPFGKKPSKKMENLFEIIRKA